MLPDRIRHGHGPFWSLNPTSSRHPTDVETNAPHFIVLGAGIGGICSAIDLAEAGGVDRDEMYRVLGREREAERPGFERLLEQTHPEDRECVAAAVDGWTAEKEPSALECRIVRKDGSTRHVRMQPRLERGEDGEFPGGSVNALVEAQLVEYATARKSFVKEAMMSDEG